MQSALCLLHAGEVEERVPLFVHGPPVGPLLHQEQHRVQLEAIKVEETKLTDS